MRKEKAEVVREVMNKLDLADALCREEVRRMVKRGEITGDSNPGIVVSIVMEKVGKMFSSGGGMHA